MIHERFDIDQWVNAFPLRRINETTDISTGLTGPLPIAYVEQIRSKVKKIGGDLGKPVPVDLCVWKAGDAKRREATKIGGVPYWPASEAWPTFARREPYTFVAQFCFADSKDILPKLPGDILSILAVEPDYADFELRWFNLSNQELLPASKVPAPLWAIRPCHAFLYRTAEYPLAHSELFENYPYPLSLWARKFTGGSKIGGLWELRGELPDPADFEDVKLRRAIEKSLEDVRRQERSFICQLGSIQSTKRQPFINVESSEDLPRSRVKKFLMIGDVGGCDFFYYRKGTGYSWWSG